MRTQHINNTVKTLVSDYFKGNWSLTASAVLYFSLLIVSFSSGFPQVVEWLLGVVNHLPSEDQCQKCLVAPVDDKEKHDDVMLGRTKCYDLVTKVGHKN